MAKMVKETVKHICKVCGAEVLHAKAFKTWADPAKKGDRPFKGMIRRCKCGIFDSTGRNMAGIID